MELIQYRKTVCHSLCLMFKLVMAPSPMPVRHKSFNKSSINFLRWKTASLHQIIQQAFACNLNITCCTQTFLTGHVSSLTDTRINISATAAVLLHLLCQSAPALYENAHLWYMFLWCQISLDLQYVWAAVGVHTFPALTLFWYIPTQANTYIKQQELHSTS